jgi:hypothetical protein
MNCPTARSLLGLVSMLWLFLTSRQRYPVTASPTRCLSIGRGINGISFSISSCGVYTMCVVPSETTGQYT